MDSSNKRIRMKIAGAIFAAALLVAVGVVVLNNTESAQVPELGHTEAIARVKGANTPLSNLPQESQVQTPHGWQIESDEPIEGIGSEEDVVSENAEDELEQDGVETDDDIDSSMQVEEDTNGQSFVAELDPNVIVTSDENAQEGNLMIDADGRGYKKRCYKNLKTCGSKKACTRKCTKKCRPYAVRRCKNKKFCRCFCKFQKHYKLAKRCVVYKKKVCKKGLQWRCKRNCKKFCKRVPHCYCCPLTHIRQHCRKLCKRTAYKSKCARCRCFRMKCYKACRFLCLKKY